MVRASRDALAPLTSFNLRAMLHDPRKYPDPDVFNPGRFLTDGRINPEILDPSDVAFGFGRRYSNMDQP